MALLLYRLGALSFDRRKTVAVIWLGLIVGITVCYLVFGGKINNEFEIPGSESHRALASLSTTIPSASGATAQVVFVAPEGHMITDQKYVAVIQQTLKHAATGPQVKAVIDPFTARAIAPDRRTAIAQVRFSALKPEIRDGTLEALEKSVGPAARAIGLRVECGGTAYGTRSVPISGKESIGLVIALIVLVITFGSLLAAGLPLLTAFIGVGVGLMSLLALTDVVAISSTAPTLALMLGLAVGIDYTLFIVSRHRSQLAAGMTPIESAAVATATAGTAVVFAGLTVIIALASLVVVGLPFLTVMGLGAAGAVAVAVIVAVTLVPALLGFAGDRLTPTPGSRAARRERAEITGKYGYGHRWVRLITQRPRIAAFVMVAALALLAIPASQLRLALPGNGQAPKDSTQRQAYDMVSKAFGPGFNGPLILVITSRSSNSAEAATTVHNAISTIARQVSGTPGVATVTQPQFSPDGITAAIPLIPTTAPDSTETKDLVRVIRERSVGWESTTGTDITLTGETAVQVDVSHRLSDALVPFVCVVVCLAFILLLVVFRSFVVPIKATVGFLLSLGASLGAVVVVFQWGWFADIVGIDTTGPVISFLPVIVIGVLFGLAMDYEVFVVSRIREEYVHTGDSTGSVISGTRHAARVVTAAALIMFFVFASFISSEDTIIKSIAFALAIGVFVDAFCVRMTIVPAVLTLVGRWGWWFPSWLDRVLPNMDIEGQRIPRFKTSENSDMEVPELV